MKDGKVEFGYCFENCGSEVKNDFLGFSTVAYFTSSSFFLLNIGELGILPNKLGALAPKSGNLDPPNKFLLYYFGVPA